MQAICSTELVMSSFLIFNYVGKRSSCSTLLLILYLDQCTQYYR